MPLIISHRTQMGTLPENTIAGIDAAIADGVDGVEIDVRATADGVPVLLHDALLARTSGDPRAVAAVALKELRSVRVDDPRGSVGPQPVPTLAEALARTAGRSLLVIEVKQPGIETAVARAVRAAEGARCWVWSFRLDVCETYRDELPGVPVTLLVPPASGGRVGANGALEAAERAALAAVSLAHRLVDRPTVDDAHRRGLEVYAWTVNEPADIERVCNAGVDAIVGDYPSRIAEVLATRG